MNINEILELAVKRDILSAQQRSAVLALATETDPPEADPADSLDERMRLIGGGNDLFVTVGIVLLLSGALFALNALLPDNWLARSILFAAGMLLLAEIVTRQKRMRLSSTIMGLGFIALVLDGLIRLVTEHYNLAAIDSIFAIAALRDDVAGMGLIVGGGSIAATIGYFARYKVPVLAAVAALLLTALAFLAALLFFHDSVAAGNIAPPTAEQWPVILKKALMMPVYCGALIFAIGVLLDLHDRERETIWSDCAFWLHVVSAPLLVHPLFIMAVGQDVVFGRIEPDATASIMLSLLIVSFVLVALAIDRRSLLVPTLAYFGSVGIYHLVGNAASMTQIPPFALILVVIGTLVILFGAGWQRIRRLIIGTTLPTSLIDRLPPIKA